MGRKPQLRHDSGGGPNSAQRRYKVENQEKKRRFRLQRDERHGGDKDDDYSQGGY